MASSRQRTAAIAGILIVVMSACLLWRPMSLYINVQTVFVYPTISDHHQPKYTTTRPTSATPATTADTGISTYPYPTVSDHHQPKYATPRNTSTTPTITTDIGISSDPYPTVSDYHQPKHAPTRTTGTTYTTATDIGISSYPYPTVSDHQLKYATARTTSTTLTTTDIGVSDHHQPNYAHTRTTSSTSKTTTDTGISSYPYPTVSDHSQPKQATMRTNSITITTAADTGIRIYPTSADDHRSEDSTTSSPWSPTAPVTQPPPSSPLPSWDSTPHPAHATPSSAWSPTPTTQPLPPSTLASWNSTRYQTCVPNKMNITWMSVRRSKLCSGDGIYDVDYGIVASCGGAQFASRLECLAEAGTEAIWHFAHSVPNGSIESFHYTFNFRCVKSMDNNQCIFRIFNINDHSLQRFFVPSEERSEAEMLEDIEAAKKPGWFIGKKACKGSIMNAPVSTSKLASLPALNRPLQSATNFIDQVVLGQLAPKDPWLCSEFPTSGGSLSEMCENGNLLHNGKEYKYNEGADGDKPGSCDIAGCKCCQRLKDEPWAQERTLPLCTEWPFPMPASGYWVYSECLPDCRPGFVPEVSRWVQDRFVWHPQGCRLQYISLDEFLGILTDLGVTGIMFFGDSRQLHLHDEMFEFLGNRSQMPGAEPPPNVEHSDFGDLPMQFINNSYCRNNFSNQIQNVSLLVASTWGEVEDGELVSCFDGDDLANRTMYLHMRHSLMAKSGLTVIRRSMALLGHDVDVVIWTAGLHNARCSLSNEVIMLHLKLEAEVFKQWALEGTKMGLNRTIIYREEVQIYKAYPTPCVSNERLKSINRMAFSVVQQLDRDLHDAGSSWKGKRPVRARAVYLGAMMELSSTRLDRLYDYSAHYYPGPHYQNSWKAFPRLVNSEMLLLLITVLKRLAAGIDNTTGLA